MAYLIGSIPFSFLVVKFMAGADIRYHGSRNVGATNVARNFGKVPGSGSGALFASGEIPEPASGLLVAMSGLCVYFNHRTLRR